MHSEQVATPQTFVFTDLAGYTALSEAGGDGGRLVNRADGYLLDVRPGERDVDRWDQALGQAHRARADGEPRAARERIDGALGIWRGQPLGGVSTNSLLAGERARLEEEHLAAMIEGIELDLELGLKGANTRVARQAASRW